MFLGQGDRLAALLLRVLASSVLLSLFSAQAQDSGSDRTYLRADRPSIALSAREGTGELITAAGTVKLLKDGVLIDEAALSRGRAFFSSLPFGDFTLVVEVTGYKSTQKDLNLSVAMRYEVDANLQREGGSSEAEGASAKPLLAPKAREALDKSLKALGSNKLSDAEKNLADAMKLAPNHPDVLYVQGVLFLDQKKWSQAQGVLEKASQMDPGNGRVFSALGMALADEGKYDAAIAPLEKSLQLDPGGWEANWTLGRVYYHQQQYDQALKTSQAAWAESKGKEPQIELLVAQALTAVGKYEDAAQALRDFLKHYADRPEATTARRWLDGLASNGKIHPN